MIVTPGIFREQHSYVTELVIDMCETRQDCFYIMDNVVFPASNQTVGMIDTEGDPRRYDYANWAGIIVNVPTEDMLHFKDLDMGRPFEAEVFGYPRGATAIGSLLADNEATQYVRQVVTNDGTPTFAVLMSDEASTEDAVAMQDRYTARVVSRGKRGVPAFFGAVKDIKPLGFNKTAFREQLAQEVEAAGYLEAAQLIRQESKYASGSKCLSIILHLLTYP